MPGIFLSMPGARARAATGVILLSLGCGGEEPTFNRDIAPIIFANCSSCHRPGEAGPFPLLSYSDVRKRATQIVDVTSRRYMPPWKPDPGYGDFLGARGLPADQIDRIRRWVNAGAPQGRAGDLPDLPEWTQGWQLGEPDLVVHMPLPAYTLAAGRGEVFRNFVLPLNLTQSRHVRAFELRPGNPRVIHHAEVVFDRNGAARRRDAEDPVPGFEGMRFGEIQNPDGHFLGWAPGTMPFSVDDSLAFTVPGGTDLVLMLHMLPSGKPEPVEAKVGLWFSDEPPTRTPMLLRLNRKDIDIPAGASSHVIEDRCELPVGIHVLGVFPHAHYLARHIEGYALLPDGSRTWLLRISDWDFSWQDWYRFVEPVFLPRGSTLVMRISYDNSASNVRNPHNPPQRVQFGLRSSDEMGDLQLQVLPSSENDRTSLKNHLARRWLRHEIDAYRSLLSAAPDDAAYHHTLGGLYQADGDVERALQHMRSALRLQPGYSEAHVNIAIIFARQGQLDQAQTHLRRALELQPDFVEAHFNLAGVYGRSGKIDSALHHFETAARLRPERVAEIRQIAAGLTPKQHR